MNNKIISAFIKVKKKKKRALVNAVYLWISSHSEGEPLWKDKIRLAEAVGPAFAIYTKYLYKKNKTQFLIYGTSIIMHSVR